MIKKYKAKDDTEPIAPGRFGSYVRAGKIDLSEEDIPESVRETLRIHL